MKAFIRWLVCLTVLFFPLSHVIADEVLPQTDAKEFFAPSTENQNFPYWKDFVNMLISLFVILALILATVWFLKKFLRSRLYQLNRSTAIKVLERRALNQKSSLYLISVLGKGVLISESPAGIQTILELPHQTNIEEAISTLKDEPNPASSFTSLFQKKMKTLLKRNADNT